MRTVTGKLPARNQPGNIGVNGFKKPAVYDCFSGGKQLFAVFSSRRAGEQIDISVPGQVKAVMIAADQAFTLGQAHGTCAQRTAEQSRISSHKPGENHFFRCCGHVKTPHSFVMVE
ncbi:hypothetical protein D3C87_1730970 [compost metagenome]